MRCLVFSAVFLIAAALAMGQHKITITGDGQGHVQYAQNDGNSNGNVEIVHDGETITWDCVPGGDGCEFTITFPASPCRTLNGGATVVCTVNFLSAGGRNCDQNNMQRRCFKYSVRLYDARGNSQDDPEVIIDNSGPRGGVGSPNHAHGQHVVVKPTAPRKRKRG